MVYIYINPNLPIPPTPSSISYKYVQVYLQNKPLSQWIQQLETKQTNQQITVGSQNSLTNSNFHFSVPSVPGKLSVFPAVFSPRAFCSYLLVCFNLVPTPMLYVALTGDT